MKTLSIFVISNFFRTGQKRWSQMIHHQKKFGPVVFRQKLMWGHKKNKRIKKIFKKKSSESFSFFWMVKKGKIGQEINHCKRKLMKI